MFSVPLKEGISALTTINGKQIKIADFILQLIHIDYMDISDKWQVEAHLHSWYELHYVSKGKAFTILDGKSLVIKPGSYYIIPPGTIHSHDQTYLDSGHIGFAIRWQLLSSDQDNNLIGDLEDEELKNKHHKIRRGKVSLIELEKGLDDCQVHKACSFEEGFNLLIKMKHCYNHSSFVLLVQLASLIISLSKIKGDIINTHVTDIKCSISYQAKIFLEDNFQQKIKISDVARALGVSYPYLARVFKKDIGKTMVSYLQEIRISEIKKLLGNTGLTIKEIAPRVGFDNEYYLSRVFKQYTDMSPSKYRNMIKNI